MSLGLMARAGCAAAAAASSARQVIVLIIEGLIAPISRPEPRRPAMRSAAWPAPLFARSTSSPARSGIDDGEPPRHRDVNAPDAHAFDQQIADGEAEQHYEQERDCEARDPAGRRAARQNNRADLVGDRPEVVTGVDHRRKVWLAVDDSWRQLFYGHRLRTPSPQKISS